jgi:hypothetical protein
MTRVSLGYMYGENSSRQVITHHCATASIRSSSQCRSAPSIRCYFDFVSLMVEDCSENQHLNHIIKDTSVTLRSLLLSALESTHAVIRDRHRRAGVIETVAARESSGRCALRLVEILSTCVGVNMGRSHATSRRIVTTWLAPDAVSGWLYCGLP